MKTNTLGQSGLTVSAVGLGTDAFGSASTPRPSIASWAPPLTMASR
ncbi:MAG: hypothetical protein AAF525_02770 [Pseudomonadota bacterium]